MTPYYEPYWLTEDELEHFGVKGMKWGVRRYQNTDGTLTEAGKEKLSKYKTKQYNRVKRYSSAYETRVSNWRTKKKQKGLKIDPERNKRIDKQISNFKKELKSIEKMKFSDMQEERVAAGKQWAKLFVVGAVGGVPAVTITQTFGIVKNPYMKVSEMRIERYDQQQKKK